jgi:quinol monooxygenase YgiN
MSSGRVSRHARTRMIAAVATVCALSAAPLAPQAVAADTPPYSETYRPQFHFTPQKNWMNDPNGLVYYQGEYHLFYQYNPNGNSWGDMSWGHAVSKDLVHWKELPLALSHDDKEMVFSGSAVVDWNNTTGFGTKKNPPMVAIYTSAYKDGGKQAQSLAYSTDRGRTWTKYQGNPVIDIGSKNFRDPKVQWYAPSPRTARWSWTRPASGTSAPPANDQPGTPPQRKEWKTVKKTLLAEFTAREGSEDEVARLLRDYARQVREEEGNLAFDVYTKAATPRAYWIFEVYRDEDAFQAHLNAPYGGPFNAALAPLIEEDASVLTFLEPVA